MSLWAAAEVVTAAKLNSTMGYVLKTADESVTSSATLQNDNHLVYAIPATGTYAFECFLHCDSAVSNTGNLRVGFSFPTGTLHMQGLGPAVGATTASNDGAWASVPSATSGTSYLPYGVIATASGFYTGVRVSGLFIATATGNLQMMWAQFASSANATTVKAGSHMLVSRKA